MQTTLLVIILLVQVGLLLLLLWGIAHTRAAGDSQQKELIAQMKQMSEEAPAASSGENLREEESCLKWEHLLLRCLHGAYPAQKQLLTDLACAGLESKAGAKIQAALFSMSGPQELPVPDALVEQVKMHLATLPDCVVFPWTKGNVLALCAAENQESLCSACRTVIRVMNDAYQVDVCCGVGEKADNLYELPRSAEQARTASLYRLFSGSQAVILYEDIAARERSAPEYPEALLQSLLRNLRQFNMTNARRDVADIFTALEECNVSTAMLGVSHLVGSICLRLQRSEKTPPFGAGYVPVMQQIGRTQTLGRMQSIVEGLLDVYADMNPSRVMTKKDDSLDAIVDYMEKHYADPDFSANDLKEIMHYSDNHIRNLFKEAYQCTPTEYLFQLRMRRAKELLANTDVKISDVAKMVGYPNSKYFYSLFKKNMDMTMNQYRIYMSNGQEQMPESEAEQ